MPIDRPPLLPPQIASWSAAPTPSVAGAESGAGDAVPPGLAQPLVLAAGARCTLPAGARWLVQEGLMGLVPALQPTQQLMTVLGPHSCLAPEQALQVMALQPLGLLRLSGSALALPPPWWRAQARAVQLLQWQSAQWAFCSQHHSPVARAASWMLLATSSTRTPLVPALHGPLPGLAQQVSEPRATGLQGPHAVGEHSPLLWQPAVLQAGLGLAAADFERVWQTLGAAGAWQAAAPRGAAVRAARTRTADARTADARTAHATAPYATASYTSTAVRGQVQALQRLACACHRPLVEALQASASASATLMPSTPADRMPPA